MILTRFTAAPTLITLGGEFYYLSPPSLRGLATLSSVLRQRFGIDPTGPQPDKDRDVDPRPLVRFGDPQASEYLCDPLAGLCVLLHVLGRRDQPDMTIADWRRAIAEHLKNHPGDDMAEVATIAHECFRRLETPDDDDPNRVWVSEEQLFRAWLRRRAKQEAALATGRRIMGRVGSPDDGKPLDEMDFSHLARCEAFAGLGPAGIGECSIDQIEAALSDTIATKSERDLNMLILFANDPVERPKVMAIRERLRAESERELWAMGGDRSRVEPSEN